MEARFTAMASSSHDKSQPSTDNERKAARRSGWYFAAVAAFDITALCVAVAVALATGADIYEGLGVAVVSIATFFALLYHAMEVRRSAEAVRDAIAGSFVLVYLLLVILTTWFVGGAPPLDPAAVTLLNSFTTVAGVVLGFYFATGTVDKYLSGRRPNKSARRAREPSGRDTAEDSPVPKGNS